MHWAFLFFVSTYSRLHLVVSNRSLTVWGVFNFFFLIASIRLYVSGAKFLESYLISF